MIDCRRRSGKAASKTHQRPVGRPDENRIRTVGRRALCTKSRKRIQ
jgi:hypothetical protein